MKKDISISTSTLVFGVILLAGYMCLGSGCADRKIGRIARRSDYDGLRRSVDKGADVNKQNKLGYTALMHASKSGNENIVELLLKAGADVDARALKDLKIIEPTDLQEMKRLRQEVKRLGMEEYARYGELTAIMIASDHGHTEVVGLLIEAGANVNAQTKRVMHQNASADGKTALMFASENGHIESVELIVEAGANVNTQTGYGSTALMCASENGHIDVVRILLEAGTHVNAKDQWEFDALMLAARAGHVEVVSILADEESDLDSALAWARTKEMAETLVSAGADRSSTSAEYPALPRQSRLGNTDIVALLLGGGAEVNTRDERWMGATALSGASEFGHIQIVGMLMKAGADVNTRDNEGRTALMSASESGHTDVVRVLIEAGADVNARDDRGWTALMKASNARSIARCGNTDIVEMLIEAGADVNARDDRGWTALMEVSGSKPWRSQDESIHLSVMRMLIDRGADVSLRTADSGTALWYAKLTKSSEKIGLLRRAGAK